MGEFLRRKIPNKPECTGEYHEKLWRICLSCWNFEPSQRPTSQAVLDDLLSTEIVSGELIRFLGDTVRSKIADGPAENNDDVPTGNDGSFYTG